MSEFLELLQLPFFVRAVLGGSLVAAVSAYVGTQVVIRRNSFFGDALAHAALTGVAVGLWWQISPTLSTLVVTVLLALLLIRLQHFSSLPLDNLLGAMLPTAMSLGVVIIALIPGYQPELLSFLFGNILTISQFELQMLIVLSILVVGVAYWYRRELVLLAIDKDLAKTSGVAVNKIDTIFHVILALTVVGAVQLVGVVLVNALLIIPATTTRTFVKSLKAMLVLSPILAVLVTLAGLFWSAQKNLPTGPAIALLAGGLLIFAITLSSLLKYRRAR